jgi:hypothetical protein
MSIFYKGDGTSVSVSGDNVVLTDDEINKCKEYSALFTSTTGRAEAMLFFTDPHMATKKPADGDVSENFNSTLDRIKAVYDNTPISTCVCGGDWLHNGNSRENACWVLGKIDGAMKSRFNKYINILGNHDTNYQGENYLTLGNAQCILSNETLSNLWYRNYGKNYFAVDGDCTKFYVFDTGIDSDAHQMNAYRWEQVDWFANELLKDNPERCASILHIGTKNYVATPFVTAITQVANAFNSKTTLTLNNKTYDFANSQGHFYFILSGHAHVDMDFVENSIPVILTTNLFNDEVANTKVPTYDLVLADYGANKVKFVRLGTGSNREIDMA